MNSISKIISYHRLYKTTSAVCIRCFSTKKDLSDEEKEIALLKKGSRLMDFDHVSLAARGYLRGQKSYTPPSDVKSDVLSACEAVTGTPAPDLTDPNIKFSVVTKCMEIFNHKLPNSLLHTINDIDSLITFYSTPVDTRVPLDRMKDIDLPKNLHVEYNYHRFNPETDTMFKGKTAFPGRSTVITGLKYKKKYKGFKHEPEWLKYKHYV